jgi:hypothetical protein
MTGISGNKKKKSELENCRTKAYTDHVKTIRIRKLQH